MNHCHGGCDEVEERVENTCCCDTAEFATELFDPCSDNTKIRTHCWYSSDVEENDANYEDHVPGVGDC